MLSRNLMVVTLWATGASSPSPRCSARPWSVWPHAAGIRDIRADNKPLLSSIDADFFLTSHPDSSSSSPNQLVKGHPAPSTTVVVMATEAATDTTAETGTLLLVERNPLPDGGASSQTCLRAAAGRYDKLSCSPALLRFFTLAWPGLVWFGPSRLFTRFPRIRCMASQRSSSHMGSVSM